ncbi:MAG: ABC transporter ATP-binding protein [Muricoprocola sp.]
MSIITIENLKYKYPGTDKLVLDGISLSIEKGEFIGIVGQNGAGKSTLCQAIVGLVPQFYHGSYGGAVKVKERLADQVQVQEMCEDVGLIFQNPFNQLSGAKDTVYGEVAYGLQNLGIEREEMKSRVERVLKQLDIWQYRDRNPFDLSGGQMQRVAIASILVMQSEVIILDEPTSQLDPEGTEEVFRVVDQLSKSGKTIIMVEQKLEKMAKYCDRLILMHDGKVIDFDTPEKIFAREDLEELGVLPPAFVRISKMYGLSNPDGTYPTTLEATARLFEHQEKLPDLAQNFKKEKRHTSWEQEEVFKIENLSFSYRKNVPVLDNLNLSLDHRATAIIGQNGAGKTTLVRLLKGLLKPVSGSIYFGGEDISKKTVAMLAGKVGYVFQNPDDQIFQYHVLDEVMFGPLNIGMTSEKAAAEAKKALEMTGLSGKEKENPYDLEIYERKMVAIASVIAMDTDVVILDEPTIAQDYPGKKRIGEMIQKLSDDGKLVIVILHDMDFVSENFDRVIVMARGTILADGTPEEVFSMDEVLKEARLEKPYMTQLFERFVIE